MAGHVQRSSGGYDPHLQHQLQALLHRLGWSYAALWSLNPRSRSAAYCSPPPLKYRRFQKAKPRIRFFSSTLGLTVSQAASW
jgi:hypothetical protein